MRDFCTETRKELTAIRVEIHSSRNDLLKWSFVFWVGAVGAVATLAGVLR
jgi:hypothetical protein